MDPISVRLDEPEQTAVDAHLKFVSPTRKGGRESFTVREMIRRYGALCGYIQLPEHEWQSVKADMDRGGVLKMLAGGK